MQALPRLKGAGGGSACSDQNPRKVPGNTQLHYTVLMKRGLRAIGFQAWCADGECGARIVSTCVIQARSPDFLKILAAVGTAWPWCWKGRQSNRFLNSRRVEPHRFCRTRRPQSAHAPSERPKLEDSSLRLGGKRGALAARQQGPSTLGKQLLKDQRVGR